MRAPPLVRDAARLLELVERELRALVARVELLDAQVHGVGAVGDGGADGVEGAGGAQEFRAGHCMERYHDTIRMTRRRATPARGRVRRTTGLCRRHGLR